MTWIMQSLKVGLSASLLMGFPKMAAAQAPSSMKAKARKPLATQPRTEPKPQEAAAGQGSSLGVTDSPKPSLLGKSAQARDKSTVQILLMTGFIPRFAYGASVAMPFGSAFLAEAFVETGSYNFLGISSTRSRYGGRVDFFPGNSFFISAGAAYDSYQGTSEGIFVDSKGTWEGSYSQLELETGIGNRWQFDSGFTIGATWGGYSQGVFKISQSSSSSGMAGDQHSFNDKDLEEQAKERSFHFAKFNIGWSF